jgi:MATE family multidrug resistance protein
MFAIGAPIGGQYLLEFAVFGTTGLLMGWLGTDAMAAHQVAANLASVTFMVPLGVSAAAAVLVGNAIGRHDAAAARRAAGAALVCGALFMLSMAALFLLLPAGLARLYTDARGVLAVAVVLIPIAGFFQVFDGIQVVSIGVLRGAGDTRAPMLINVAGFWVVGMPLSLLLAFRLGLQAAGLWWGLVAGLAAVAILLVARVLTRMAGPLERLRVD